MKTFVLVLREVLESHKGLGRKRDLVSEQQRLLERQAETAMATDVLNVEKSRARHPALQLYKDKHGAVDPERASNVPWLQCLDRMLVQSVGWGFGQYIPKRRPVAIVEGQTRKQTTRPDGEQRVRNYFEGPGGEKVYEIARLVALDKREVLPCLHLCIDEGPTGWPASVYLAARGRITVTPDTFHRQHNDWLLAIGHSGLVDVRNAYKPLGKLRRAPWSSEGHHEELIATAKHFFATHTVGHPLVQWLLDDLSAEMGCSRESRGLTPEEELDLFKQLGHELCKEPLGAELKSSRWFNYECVARHSSKHKCRTLLLLLVLGIRRKWWSTLCCPLVRARCAEKDDGMPRDSSGHAKQKNP
eukprot:5494429-Amphidinium_carterae.3